MTRLICLSVVAVLMGASVSAQQAPAVEVASIKQNVAGGGAFPPNVVWLPGDRMSASGLTLAELIRSAYVGDGIQLMSQIIGGPSWVTAARFDIIGKLSNVATGNPDEANSQRRVALKAMLVERFMLRLHRETRELPVFNLVIADKSGKLGPHLKTSACTRLGDRPCVPFRMVGMDPTTGITMRTEGATMSEFAAAIVSFPEIGRTVRDHTGLTGAFDLQLTLPPPTRDAATDSGILTALPEQLGLKLEGRNDQADVILIDNAALPSED